MAGRVSFGVGFLVCASMLGCSSRDDHIVVGDPGVLAPVGGSVPQGPTVSATPAPPPIAGGTLLIGADGRTAVVSDPDRDRIVVADVELGKVVGEIRLEANDEPGRAVQDAAGLVHVALRRGGAVVSIDPVKAALVGRRSVCPAPRGIAYDATADLLHIACDTGELVSIAPGAQTPSQTLRLGRDLRDVVVNGDRLLVSRFRSAAMLVINSTGTHRKTLMAPSVVGSGRSFDPMTGTPSNFAPAVAWRMIGLPDGRVAMLHQGALESAVQTEVPNGYGSAPQTDPCSLSIVTTALTAIDPDADTALPPTPSIPGAVTAVDIALSGHDDPRQRMIALVAAGNNWGAPHAQLLILPAPPPPGEEPPPGSLPCQNSEQHFTSGEAVAVAYDGQNRWVVQSREPAQLELSDGLVIALGGESRKDTGLALFHMNSGAGIACASCHPEGRDDARTWTFAPIGERRTQVPSGGVMDTAPFHWSGDMTSFGMLVHEVFSSRMGGGEPSTSQLQAFASWIDAMPAPDRALAADLDAADRGRSLFESANVGCAVCHSGPKLSNNETHDVGTGGFFQVSSLVGISARAPFIHNGCAATLHDRFTNTACGGGDFHGTTSQLSPAQVDDLVAYLETL